VGKDNIESLGSIRIKCFKKWQEGYTKMADGRRMARIGEEEMQEAVDTLNKYLSQAPGLLGASK
jgi:hypothetical protein